MNTRYGWGGVARTSRDHPQEPHYGDEVEGPSQVQDEVSGGELGGLQSGPRSTRRCDVVVVLGSDRCLDAPPERPAGRVVCDRSRPARASISCSTARVCPSSGQVSGPPRNTVAAAGGSSTLASISQT